MCRPCLLNQKHNIGWFLLRFVDLLRVFSLHIIGRNHSNTFLLINMQKTKLVQTKILEQGLLVLTSSYDFRLVFVHYLMSNGVQIGRWLHLSSSLLVIPIRCRFFKKRIDQKNPLL